MLLLKVDRTMNTTARLNQIESRMKATNPTIPTDALSDSDNAQIDRILEAFMADEDAPADCDPALAAIVIRMMNEL